MWKAYTMKDKPIYVTVTKDDWVITGEYPLKTPYITLYCQGKPFEVINVWDYRISPSKSTIPDDRREAKKSIKNEIQEWLDAIGSDLDNEMHNYMLYTR